MSTEENLNANIAKNLSRRLESTRLTNSELAKIACVQPVEIERALEGMGIPLSALFWMARFFGCAVDDFLSGEPVPKVGECVHLRERLRVIRMLTEHEIFVALSEICTDEVREGLLSIAHQLADLLLLMDCGAEKALRDTNPIPKQILE
jgi:hypothetical protein